MLANKTAPGKKAANEKPPKKNGISAERNRRGKRMFLLLIPFIILVLLFSYYPLFGWVYAFFDYRPPLPLHDCQFVGLQWFQMMFNNPEQRRTILQVLENTFAMSALGIIGSIFPLFFAIGLNEIRIKWLKNGIQTFTTLPNFISWVLVYAVAFALFSSNGMVNNLLQNWHWISQPIKFLDSDSHTWLKMWLWQTWKGLGWGSIIYLAALSGIDPELYEAARVDGANKFQLIRNITLPALMPTYAVMLMLAISNFLNNGMDQYYVFQNAFNMQHVQVLDSYVYNVGMGQNSLSFATAISMLKSLISVALLFIVNWVSKRTRGSSIV